MTQLKERKTKNPSEIVGIERLFRTRWMNAHPCAQIFTIADDESDGSMMYSEVPLQRAYIGWGAIPSSMASIPCTSLGVGELLRRLNGIMGTEFTLPTPSTFPLESPLLLLQPLLTMCIERQFDFGRAYAYLRPLWNRFNKKNTDRSVLSDLIYGSSTNTEILQRFLDSIFEKEDDAMREDAIDGKNQTVNPNIPPRRVWDLFSNRVVPFWTACHSTHIRNALSWIDLRLVAISHAWMRPHLRHFVSTSINNHEWAVPIPIDTTLERVRIEMLNYGLEYAWLDVLCLRQEGVPENEDLRLEEWKIDVPTIGRVYCSTGTKICYFNGLGRPFEVGDMDDDHHWLNRAWIMQECQGTLITVGQTESIPRHTRIFYNRIAELYTIHQCLLNSDVRGFLGEMVRRSAHNELDKISGLAYLVGCYPHPVFIAAEDPELAWMRFVEVMHQQFRGNLFFWYPTPGDGPYSWCPSWSQVSSTTGCAKGQVFNRFNSIDYDEEQKKYSLSAEVIEGMLISTVNGKGRYVVATDSGYQSHIFVQNRHTRIQPGRYTFIAYREESRAPLRCFVTGHNTSQGFRKICNLNLCFDNGVEPLGSLRKLYLI